MKSILLFEPSHKKKKKKNLTIWVFIFYLNAIIFFVKFLSKLFLTRGQKLYNLTGFLMRGQNLYNLTGWHHIWNQ